MIWVLMIDFAYNYHMWGNFRVGKIDEFGQWNAIQQSFTYQLVILFIISCSYACNSLADILPSNGSEYSPFAKVYLSKT